VAFRVGTSSLHSRRSDITSWMGTRRKCHVPGTQDKTFPTKFVESNGNLSPPTPPEKLLTVGGYTNNHDHDTLTVLIVLCNLFPDDGNPMCIVVSV
jgi:hypothetical protein